MTSKKNFPFMLLFFELVYTALILYKTIPLLESHDTDAALAWIVSLFFVYLGVYVLKGLKNRKEYRIRLLFIPLGIFFLCYLVYGILQFDKKVVEKENFVWYVEEGRLEKVKELLEGNSIDQSILEEAMTAAIKADKPEAIEILTTYGCPLDYSRKTNAYGSFIYYAAKNKSFLALEELLRMGSDINAGDPREGLTVLHMYFKEKWDNLTLLEFLLDKNADPNRADNKGDSALHYAARYYGSREELEMLILYDGDINKPNNGALPPLFMADSQEWKDLFRGLGAHDIHINEDTGATDLHIAAAEGNIGKIVEILKLALISPDRANFDGWSPLYYGITENQFQSVQTLIDGGADVNFRDQWEQTPLIIASEYAEDNAILTLLLENGADPHLRSQYDVSALSLAVRNWNNITGAELLSTYGALADYKTLTLILENKSDFLIYCEQTFGEDSQETKKALKEYKKTLETLWNHPARLDPLEWEYLLKTALFQGEWDCIITAIDRGAKLESWMLDNVYSRDNGALLRRLYDTFPEIHSAFATDVQRNELLFKQINFNHLSCAAFLLELGAEINARGGAENTILHRVIQSTIYNKGDEQQKNEQLRSKIQLMIESGADLNARNNEGYTPEEHGRNLGLDREISELLTPKD